MNKQYDFSKGTRGKFYRPNATLHIPVYLDPAVQRRVEAIAHRKRQDAGTLINRIVRKELELIEEKQQSVAKER